MPIELTPQQRAILLELVNRELMEIGPEIHHTWTSAYRATLKDERHVLLEVRDLLADALADASADPPHRAVTA